MSTLRRFVKYSAVAVMGLLVVAWVVSVFCEIGFISTNPVTRDLGTLVLGQGDIFIRFDSRLFSNVKFAITKPSRFRDEPIRDRDIVGMLLFVDNSKPGPWKEVQTNLGTYAVRIPLPLLITFMLPLAIASFNSFRFRLWHYFAFIAILSLELAYYLQWQNWNPRPISDDPFAARVELMTSDRC